MKLEKIPVHVGIIMDGNGRWAKKRGLPRIEGHKKGAEVAEKIISFAKELGIKYITLYAFSTENWKRPKGEVDFLMRLFERAVKSDLRTMKKNSVRLRVAGRREGLPDSLRKWLDRAEEETVDGRWNFIVCLNYGGRDEIIRAVNRAVERGEKVDERSFRKLLDLPDVPDLDLVIRTSGEQRISNFMLYRLAYAELYFTPVYFPDFSKEEFEKAVEWYRSRERRFGGVGEGSSS